MITNQLKNDIDRLWTEFWTGGITNPLTVIEQISFLMFARLLDMTETRNERKAMRTGRQGTWLFDEADKDLRWSRFKNFVPAEMFTVVGEREVPFLRNMGGDGSTYSQHMKDARFTIPTSGLLAKVVDILDHVPMEDRDTKGDLYEYMLGKIAAAGQNGHPSACSGVSQLMRIFELQTKYRTGPDQSC